MTLLAQLAATSDLVTKMSGRRAKVDALAELLRRLGAEEIEIAVAFLTGSLRQTKLGVGPALITSARPSEQAASATLTLQEVDARLDAIAAVKGAGAAAERRVLLGSLLQQGTGAEQDFLMRLLFGELRQGALEGLMVEAIARASTLPLSDVRRAAMLAGGLGVVARAAMVEGAPGLSRFSLKLFQPVLPMLAQPTENAAAALEALGTAAFEWKLDGARVQVHKAGDEVRVYTRNLNDVTPAVPEVVDAVRALADPSLILDGETIALDLAGAPQPFQVTMRRFGRKLDIDDLRRSLPLSVFFFDVLHRDGRDLIDAPARERFHALGAALPAGLIVPRVITGEAAAALAFMDDALARGHEGVMAKALDAPYEAGGRGGSWLKLKQAHTRDLVVLSAEWGSGRRRGWLSNLHLGARDPGSGAFVMLGTTFKGLTDEMLAWQTEQLLTLETSRDRHVVHVRPELVVEIALNDVQESPHYPAGMALRFARVKRYRTDKRADQADTVETVRKLFLRGRPSEN